MTSVPTSAVPPVAVTVVVVANGGRESEPYLGRPPAGDECYVFGQHPLESAFVLDLRLRDRLTSLLDEGHRISGAVLVWDSLEAERDIMRRAQLVARRLGAGGKLTLATKQPNLVADERFQAFKARLSERLKFLGVELVVFTPDQNESTPAPAPLTAAWNRLQRFRGFAEFEPEEAATPDSNLRSSMTRLREPQSSVEELKRSAVFARNTLEPAKVQQVRRATAR
jgi:hypothetical protein